MNCFKCGSKCLTNYLVHLIWTATPDREDKVSHVRKQCMNCEWSSFPTQMPKTRKELNELGN